MASSKTSINDLPQPILIHILSFLYLPEAIQASLVSPSFRDLWHFLPSLHFNIMEFYSRSTSPTPRCDNSRNLFAEFVSKTLMFRQPNPLTKLHLTFEYANHEMHKQNVRAWIRFAINLSVSELVLDFPDDNKLFRWPDPDFEDFCFDFYLSDIGNSRVKVLKLNYCGLILPPKTNPVKFVFLKSLILERIQTLGTGDVCYLLKLCVNLEILKLEGMIFAATEEGLVIHSSSLKEFYLAFCYNYGDLVICCPSLRKISIELSKTGKVINKDTTHLVEACIGFKPLFLDVEYNTSWEEYNKSWEEMLSCFTNITNIHVWHELLESNEVPIGCEQYASNVKHLELYIDYDEVDIVGLAALLKLLPKLEILLLDNRKIRTLHNRGPTNPKLHKDCWLASTVFNMPCLRKVILRKYQKTEGEQHFIGLFKKNSVVLEKIELLHFSPRKN